MVKQIHRFYVYVLFRENGQPFYIGKGSRGRLSQHLAQSSTRTRNSYKDAIIRKMLAAGLDVPRVKIRTKLSEAEAFEVETALIRAIGRYPDGPLVNLTDGGEGRSGRTLTREHRAVFTRLGCKHTPEAIERMREAQKGHPGNRKGAKNSDLQRTRSSEANRGNKHALGRVVSQETRDKISQAQKGKVPSAACVEAAKRANTGRKKTAAESAKLSAALKARPRPVGRKLSDAHKAALFAANIGNQHTKGRKLTPDEIARRTATLRANRSPETIAKRSALLKGRKQTPEHIAARMAAKAAAKLRRDSEAVQP